MMDLDINTKWPEKSKRTISLEVYIKMQNDIAIAAAKNTNDIQAILEVAKRSVDTLLEFNNVEVEL